MLSRILTRIGKCRHGVSLNAWCERCQGAASATSPDIFEAITREQEMVTGLLRQQFAWKFPHLARLMYGTEEPVRNVCPACGEPTNADGYCPTIQAKLEEARTEFDDEIAYQTAEEWDWFHRHPNADRWTQL